MSDDRLSTDLLVSAQIRIAGQQGVPIVILHRGDATSGTIILKINRLDGTARVLSQVRLDDELVWSPVTNADTMSDAEADRYMGQQTNMDPDIWLIEIEDRQARHWFPGRIARL